MPTPITGQGRISIPYTVTGLVHTAQYYVAAPTLAAGVYSIPLRPSVGGAATFAVCADALAANMSITLEIGTTAGDAVLSIFDGTLWNPVASEVVGLTQLVGTATLASQLTVTLRDEQFHHIKPTVMECNQPTPNHFESATGGSPSLDGFIQEFTQNFTFPTPPFYFVQSIWGQYIRVSPFVATTITYNRKLRKARGLA